MRRLSDDELDAYAHHADVQADEPLAALVAELQQRRRTAQPGKRWAIVVLAAQQAGLLPQLISPGSGGPILIIAPDGTRLPLRADGTDRWALETYDPTSSLELRQLLQTYGISGHDHDHS